VPNGAADVVWDRRIRDRRKGKGTAEGQERRLATRRGPHPVSWTGLGFVVCERRA